MPLLPCRDPRIWDDFFTNVRRTRIYLDAAHLVGLCVVRM